MNRTFSSSLRAALGRPNRVLGWGLGIAVSLLGVILYVPRVRQFFALGELHADDLAMCLLAALSLLVVLELAKMGWRRRLES